MCHVNLLNPYYSFSDCTDTITISRNKINVLDTCIKPVLLTDSCGVDNPNDLTSTSVIVGGEVDEVYPGDSVLQGRLRNSEALNSLHVQLYHLTDSQHTDDQFNYRTLFSDAPSCTNLIDHDIDVGYIFGWIFPLSKNIVSQHFFNPGTDTNFAANQADRCKCMFSHSLSVPALSCSGLQWIQSLSQQHWI